MYLMLLTAWAEMPHTDQYDKDREAMLTFPVHELTIIGGDNDAIVDKERHLYCLGRS